VLRIEKGLKHLVDAAGMLRTPPTGLRLAIVGDGVERDALARQIESSGVGDRIAMFPFSGRTDPHLAALDGVVLPSDSFEALPIGVIEGMAHSLPVIGSRIGGVPELISDGESGLLVPPGDPSALAAAIDEIAADPERAAAMGRRGRQIAEERYDLNRMVGEVERQYLEVSARRTGGEALSGP
jgi:glycosyltransferase involved in cell wall biosynthesis